MLLSSRTPQGGSELNIPPLELGYVYAEQLGKELTSSLVFVLIGLASDPVPAKYMW